MGFSRQEYCIGLTFLSPVATLSDVSTMTRLSCVAPWVTSWQIDGETVETVADFIFLGSKITADSDCCHQIKRCLLLGRKVMTNLDSILKSRDITLSTKVRWEGLGAGGEGNDRGWDGWMASPTQWAWVWVDSGSWWRTGRPGVQWFMGSQRVAHAWVTELNWYMKQIWRQAGGFSVCTSPRLPLAVCRERRLEAGRSGTSKAWGLLQAPLTWISEQCCDQQWFSTGTVTASL